VGVTKHCRVSLHTDCVCPNTEAPQSLTCTVCKQRQNGKCSTSIAKCNDGSCEVLVQASAISCDGVVRSKPPRHTCRVCKHGASCVWVCKVQALRLIHELSQERGKYRTLDPRSTTSQSSQTRQTHDITAFAKLYPHQQIAHTLLLSSFTKSAFSQSILAYCAFHLLTFAKPHTAVSLYPIEPPDLPSSTSEYGIHSEASDKLWTREISACEKDMLLT